MEKLKNNKGITLVSLIITIVLMFIIAGTTIYTSTNRFKINSLKKMYNDIELLNDKISTYYVKYGGIPILKNSSGDYILYTFSNLDFDKSINDDSNYYIIDLEAIGNMTLNYGEEGYSNPNTSDDVYIVNNKTHTVYYVKGIENANGKIYHSLETQSLENEDTVPPTKPQINVISGIQDETNEGTTQTRLYYTSDVTLEFIPGKDNWSGISKTTYSINNGAEIDVSKLQNNEYTLNTNGSYDVKVKSYDNNLNYAETILTINITK